MKVTVIVSLFLLSPVIGSVRAQEPLHDPSLPSVAPKALQQLSDTRIRQRIMQASQAPYHARCVCPYQIRDGNGRSCRGRHEVVRTPPRPICYPAQVTGAMIDDWRRAHTD